MIVILHQYERLPERVPLSPFPTPHGEPGVLSGEAERRREFFTRISWASSGGLGYRMVLDGLFSLRFVALHPFFPSMR